MKKSVLDLLTKKGAKTELKLGFRFVGFHDYWIFSIFMIFFSGFLVFITHYVCVCRKPAVIMIVGVNGGGKTTSLGMFDDNGFYIP